MGRWKYLGFPVGPKPNTSSLGALKAMQKLDLSDNNLTGGVPLELGNLALLPSLNLSFYKLSGQVPTDGVFKNKSAVMLGGNLKLCGGIPQLSLPSCVENSRKLLSIRSIVIISVTCGVFLLALVLLAILLFRRKKHAEKSELPSSNSMEEGHQRMSYKELFDATDGFSPTNLIGAGSFGSVFKGNLKESNQQVAVKVLNLQKSGASKSFMTECNALKEIRHRNLLKIITSCSSIDFKGNEFMALVYELMPNGSLEGWVHGSMKLNLNQRLDIALDVASALDYLHHQCETPVVHCDLKPSNILLYKDMVAHVGAFSLAKLLQDHTESSKKDQTYSSAINGTVGYVAPEYAYGGRVSTDGDVYSYGLLVLETFTGKRPTDEMFKDGMTLREFSCISTNVTDIIDPTLLTESNEEACDREATQAKMCNCFAAVIALGNACSAELPNQRMNITDAISELYAIRKKFLNHGTGK